jgi:hypothetical protein
MVSEVFRMRRVEDLIRISYPRPAETFKPALGGLEGFGDGAPMPRPVRRRNRCRVCMTLTPDERTLCSYCQRFVD